MFNFTSTALIMKKLFLLSFLFVFLAACNKEPGQGGTSSISGKIYRIETNTLGQVLDEYYAPDYDVYIIYGNEDKVYDDKFSTSYEGSYEFTNLTPGTYEVFAYTRCDLCGGGDTAVSQIIEITEKAQVINLDDIQVYK
ncbi:MAG: hypothetical protein ACI857_000086 [Arenicella sp.]|jgi:hypothetical protein